VEALKDILMPDHIGCGAYEYCEEHGLFHVGAHKGEHLYINPQYETGQPWGEGEHRKSFEDLKTPIKHMCFTSIEWAKIAESARLIKNATILAYWDELRLVAEHEV
jgi:hypothetical protein